MTASSLTPHSQLSHPMMFNLKPVKSMPFSLPSTRAALFQASSLPTWIIS